MASWSAVFWLLPSGLPTNSCWGFPRYPDVVTWKFTEVLTRPTSGILEQHSSSRESLGQGLVSTWAIFMAMVSGSINGWYTYRAIIQPIFFFSLRYNNSLVGDRFLPITSGQRRVLSTLENLTCPTRDLHHHGNTNLRNIYLLTTLNIRCQSVNKRH